MSGKVFPNSHLGHFNTYNLFIKLKVCINRPYFLGLVQSYLWDIENI